MTQDVTLGVVIVSYNSEMVLSDCLTALCGDPRIRVIVVDNDSNDGSLELAARFGVETLALQRNTGFAYACNAGVRQLLPGPQWLAFVNPDVVISSAELLRTADDAPTNTWILSPLLLDPMGAPLADIIRPQPTLGASIARYLLTSRGDLTTRRRMRLLQSSNDRYVQTEVTSGACMVMRCESFIAVNGFDESYFLNMEDVDICCRVRALNGGIAVDRFVSGLHIKGSASSITTSEQRMFECARAEVVFFQQNRPAWQTVVVGGAALFGCVGRSLVRRQRGPTASGRGLLRGPASALARQIGISVHCALTKREAVRPALPVFVDG